MKKLASHPSLFASIVGHHENPRDGKCFEYVITLLHKNLRDWTCQVIPGPLKYKKCVICEIRRVTCQSREQASRERCATSTRVVQRMGKGHKQQAQVHATRRRTMDGWMDGWMDDKQDRYSRLTEHVPGLVSPMNERSLVAISSLRYGFLMSAKPLDLSLTA